MAGDAKDISDTKASQATQPRKPYQTPELKRLGSVRELTLGPLKSNVADAITGFVKPM